MGCFQEDVTSICPALVQSEGFFQIDELRLLCLPRRMFVASPLLALQL